MTPPGNNGNDGTAPGRMGGMADAQLFALLAGERAAADAAFAELYARHATRVYAYCRCVFGGRAEAEDVFQETFTRFLESGRRGAAVANVPGYLVTTARNLSLNVRRDARPTVPIEEWHALAGDRPYERKELLDLVNAAMDLLPAPQREALFLRDYEDLDYDEIASMLDVTPLTVRLRVSRGRKRLRGILHPYLVETTQK
jgi:RNA polymerase sigma-70 factor (ECF subfamily)